MFNKERARIQAMRASIAGLALLIAPFALAVEVTGSFTGWWDQPDQQNHGVIISVTELPTGERFAALYWANFDDEGNPSWLLGQGEIVGDTIEAELYRVDGVTFMQSQDPSATTSTLVGTMTVQFSNCNQGDVAFDAPEVIVGTGGAPSQFKIKRLTNQPGVNCSGGISDNTRPTALPETFRAYLVPPAGAPVPGASGRADFESRPGLAEFSVEIEDLPVGDYTLRIGTARGTISVVSTPSGNEGEIEFRSPEDTNRPLLTFDPRDQLIEIVRADGEVMLATLAPTTGEVPGSTTGTPPPFGDEEIAAELDSAVAGASGSASLERDANRVDFEIEIEDLPVATYAVRIDGVDRGEIIVADTPSGPEGEIEFRFPGEAGKETLDFDPRGLLIEIVDRSDSSTVVMSAAFPAQGAGDDDDGSDDDGGAGDDGDGGDDDNDDGDDGGGDDDDEEDDG